MMITLGSSRVDTVRFAAGQMQLVALDLLEYSSARHRTAEDRFVLAGPRITARIMMRLFPRRHADGTILRAASVKSAGYQLREPPSR
jgi:uncharacterized DUF497 family protein